jgi:hypothetical protein
VTREELSKILEQFATCAISTAMVPHWTVDEQYDIICNSIDKIVTTVMIATDRNRLVTPSIN